MSWRKSALLGVAFATSGVAGAQPAENSGLLHQNPEPLQASSAVPMGNSDAPEPDGGQIEAIVTAQRRAQNVQDVPIAVTALTAQQLTTSGVISKCQPNLRINTGFLPDDCCACWALPVPKRRPNGAISVALPSAAARGPAREREPVRVPRPHHRRYWRARKASSLSCRLA